MQKSTIFLLYLKVVDVEKKATGKQCISITFANYELYHGSAFTVSLGLVFFICKTRELDKIILKFLSIPKIL